MARKKSTEAGGKPAGKPAAPSAGLSELLGRALTDKQFRDQLHTDQEAAVRGVGQPIDPADVALQHAALGTLAVSPQVVPLEATQVLLPFLRHIALQQLARPRWVPHLPHPMG